MYEGGAIESGLKHELGIQRAHKKLSTGLSRRGMARLESATDSAEGPRSLCSAKKETPQASVMPYILPEVGPTRSSTQH